MVINQLGGTVTTCLAGAQRGVMASGQLRPQVGADRNRQLKTHEGIIVLFTFACDNLLTSLLR